MTNPEREQFYAGLHPLMREWVAAVEAELAKVTGWEGHFVAQEKTAEEAEAEAEPEQNINPLPMAED